MNDAEREMLMDRGYYFTPAFPESCTTPFPETHRFSIAHRQALAIERYKDAAVRDALEGAAKVADKEGSICHYGVDSDGKTVPDMVGIHCGNANKVAARIRAMIPTGGEEGSDG